MISELLRGALSNPVHLQSALKTKFVKRILSFLRPSNRLFSATSWNSVCMPQLERQKTVLCPECAPPFAPKKADTDLCETSWSRYSEGPVF